MLPEELQELLEKADGFVKQINAVNRWKGNYPPDTEHFPEDSIRATAGIAPVTSRAWVQFDFTDDDGAHSIRVESDLTKVGAKGGNDRITFDGVDVEDDEFTIAPVTGLENFNFYVRVKAEFKFTKDGEKKHVRFDGPV